MSGFVCINCGEKNGLGDCCPECAAFDCDGCGDLIDLDADFLDETTGARYCEACAIKETLL